MGLIAIKKMEFCMHDLEMLIFFMNLYIIKTVKIT